MRPTDIDKRIEIVRGLVRVNNFINDKERKVPSYHFRFLVNKCLPINANWNKSLNLQEKAGKITKVFM